MRNILAVLVFALACIDCNAQTIGLHTISAHQHGGFSNVDPGIYVRSEGWTGGIYRNSYRKISTYAGYTWETEGTISFAVTVGAVTGYPAAPIMPLLVPSMAVHFGGDAVRLGFVPRPPTGAGSSAALHLMVEHTF